MEHSTNAVFDLYTSTSSPIIISVPHSGVSFPPEIKNRLNPEIASLPPDTDWKVHEVYNFAREVDISIISANLSRYVIDLNRDPEGRPLYNDNRVQTASLPLQTFSLKPIYQNGAEPTEQEKEQRKKDFFDPYYREIRNHLIYLKKKFENVLLFDAHSIRRHVPSIQSAHFPDLILGTRDGHSCHSNLQNKASEALASSPYSLKINSPFKGGHITRTFGQPQTGIHAMQLEMSQDIYLNEDTKELNLEKCALLRRHLRTLFQTLSRELQQMNESQK